MNCKKVLSIVIVMILPLSMVAQANILNAKKPEEIGEKTVAQKAKDNDTPLKYTYVDDRDILWSKTVWEIIDLDERVNFPLYYPMDTINTGFANRKSLYDVLLENIRNGKLTDIYEDSYFKKKRKFSDLKYTLQRIDTTDAGYEQFNTGVKVSEMNIDTMNLTAKHLIEYHIKGIWYFDKRQGELKYRLLGIAPVMPDVNFIYDNIYGDIDGDNIDGDNKIALFWVWYPSARKNCTKQKCSVNIIQHNRYLLICC